MSIVARLAVLLRMPQREVLERLTAREIAQWQAFWRIEKW